MNCRCPACRRTTYVPPDLADYLARCDRCKAHFVARTSEASEQLQRFADVPAEPVAPLPRVHLADLLRRSPVQTVAPAPRAPDPPPSSSVDLASLARQWTGAQAGLRPRELRRFQLQWRRHALGVIGICGIVAVALLVVCIALLRSNGFPQPNSARGENSSHLTPPTSPPASAHADTTADSSSKTGDLSGELFPSVPAEK